jgi:hypothetical protein
MMAGFAAPAALHHQDVAFLRDRDRVVHGAVIRSLAEGRDGAAHQRRPSSNGRSGRIAGSTSVRPPKASAATLAGTSPHLCTSSRGSRDVLGR